MNEVPLDTFRPSTLGWLKGTLAGWGTVLLFIAGIVLWLMNTMNLGMLWLRCRWPRSASSSGAGSRISRPNTTSPRNG